MADELPGGRDAESEIQDILADLDGILSPIISGAAALPPSPPPKPAAPPPPPPKPPLIPAKPTPPAPVVKPATVEFKPASPAPVPKADIPAPRPAPAAPKIEIPAPKVESPAPRPAPAAPRIEIPAPKIEIPAPKAEPPARKPEPVMPLSLDIPAPTEKADHFQTHPPVPAKKAPAEVQIPRPKPLFPPDLTGSIEVVLPPGPEPAGPVLTPSPSPVSEELRIELSPQAGVPQVKKAAPPTPKVELAAPKVEPPPPKVELTAPKAEPALPKVELAAPKVEIPVPKIEPPAPKVELAPPKVEPPAVKSDPPKAEVSAPAAGPSAPDARGGREPFKEEPIPDKTPKEQVRRLAILYSAQQEGKINAFKRFLFEVGQKVSKKPLYIHVSLTLEVTPELRPEEVLDRVQKSGAAGALALMEGLKDDSIRNIEEIFGDKDFFFRQVAPGDVGKRTVAIDLVVDLMLLRSG